MKTTTTAAKIDTSKRGKPTPANTVTFLYAGCGDFAAYLGDLRGTGRSPAAAMRALRASRPHVRPLRGDVVSSARAVASCRWDLGQVQARDAFGKSAPVRTWAETLDADYEPSA